MSKKDKAQEQTQATAAVPAVSPAVPSLADVLKDAEGVTVSDDTRRQATARHSCRQGNANRACNHREIGISRL